MNIRLNIEPLCKNCCHFNLGEQCDECEEYHEAACSIDATDLSDEFYIGEHTITEDNLSDICACDGEFFSE